MKNILTRSGVTTEHYRIDWEVSGRAIHHIISVRYLPRKVSAWHCHEHQVDHFSVINGQFRVVLFDGRPDSPTKGTVEQVRLSDLRPLVLVVPPGVWHGVENLCHTDGLAINFFDRPYDYENPDEWRLPQDTDQIPFSFDVAP
ncbi:dTDP-4-dehydrorhamnose 3,5-epimerase family protein [Maricaulis sp. CAU 1757]